jgi:translation initiation factor IF-3
MEKRLRDVKKNQTTIKIKEIRMQPKIEKHDIETKGKFIADFLSQGNKVKISIRFRGREMAHTDLGKDTLNKILENLTANGVEFNLDRPPLMEGKMMSIMVSPRNAKGQQAKTQAQTNQKT